MKNTIFTVLASIGIWIVVLFTPFASWVTLIYLHTPDAIWSSWPGPGELFGLGFLITFTCGFVGAVLALIGGLNARPRFMWIALILVGLFYCISFIGEFYSTYKLLAYPQAWPYISHVNYVYDFLFLLPGLSLVAEGLIIRKPKFQHQT